MRIKNALEHQVRGEVEALKSGRAATHACFCPRCTADMICLSLGKLPPRYCIDSNYSLAEARNYEATIRDAVKFAANRVKVNPRHLPGKPPAGNIRIVNIPLEEGLRMVRVVMQRYGVPCVCDQCAIDTIAMALCRHRNTYGVEHDGRCGFTEQQRDFIRYDLLIFLRDACQTVAVRPHH
jgi:hypothetical protein